MSQFNIIFPVVRPALGYIIIINRRKKRQREGREEREGREGKEGREEEDIKRKQFCNSTYDQESE